jgi:hypothetical protein
LRGWRAIVALQKSDWAELKAVAAQDKPIWSNVAAANLGEKVSWGKLNKDAAAQCFNSLIARSNQVDSLCEDELARAALIWTNESLPQERRRLAENDFFRMYAAKSLLEKAARANAVAGDRWDVASSALREPALVDLIMAWPTLKKYRASLKRQIAERK